MISLACPIYSGHRALSLYVLWSDVPEWWECSCGSKHHKSEPFKYKYEGS